MKKAAIIFLLCLFALPRLAGQTINFRQKPIQSERSRRFDALHYRISVFLDIKEKSFQGNTTVTLSSLQNGLDKIVLDAEAFTVIQVRSQWGEELPFCQSEKHRMT